MTRRIQKSDLTGIIDHDTDINVEPFILAATALTDAVADHDDNGLLSDELLREIERCLAGHFYEKRDQAYSSKSTDGASGSFQGQWGKLLERTSWGQDALILDITGFLQSIQVGRQKASMDWLGKAPSDQTDFADRD